MRNDITSGDVELQTLLDHFETFLDATQDARADAEKCRDYNDHKQWTDDEVAKLEARGQAPIVNNRIAPKVKFMVGEQQRRRRKPKAYPRTPEHEETADAITDALRYVCDNNDFKHISSAVFENEIIEGIGGCITEVKQKNGEYEVVHTYIPWDRYYYDPHSRAKDFSDKKFDGIVLWLDKDDVIDMFPDKKEDIDYLLSSASARTEEETFDDRPLWIDRKRKRLKVCQHYFIHKDKWHVAFFTDGSFLRDPEPVSYVDEFGEPQNPIETQSAFIDRDNNRYGEVKGYIHIQDEINHRHSKYLHLLSVRQTWGTQGAVIDVQKMKEESAKPNGHLEFEHGKMGENFGFVPTGDMAMGQYNLLQEAKNEIDAISVNAALTGTEERNLSGRALIAKQQGGLTELGPIYDGHRSWELRVYRQTWNRVKQFWDKEKWIRVTDDEKNLKWVGLNQPMTYAELLQEKIEDDETPPEMKEQAAMLLQTGDPRLNQQAEVRNYVPEIDVDIIIEDGEDSITIQQEQFQVMTTLAQAYGPEAVPFEVILELSSLPNKDQVMDMLKGGGDDNAMEQRVQEIQAVAQQAISELQNQLKLLQEDKSLEAGKLELENKRIDLEARIKEIETALTARDLDIKERGLVIQAQEAADTSETDLKRYEIDVNASTEIQKAVIEGEARVKEAACSNPPMEPMEPQPINIQVGGGIKQIELQRDSQGNATGATVVEQ